jgi:inner membrane protein
VDLGFIACGGRETITAHMASLITHALVGTALGQAASPECRRRPAFWAAAVVCSILPDADVIGFQLGVHYGDLWGHRGMTHSLLFAAVLAAGLAVGMERDAAARWKLASLYFVITASHGVLDAMTNGGLGVAFFSPFDRDRYFFPWRPLRVSPIGTGVFFSSRGVQVLSSERWVWGSALVVSALLLGLRAWRRVRGEGGSGLAASSKP